MEELDLPETEVCSRERKGGRKFNYVFIFFKVRRFPSTSRRLEVASHS